VQASNGTPQLTFFRWLAGQRDRTDDVGAIARRFVIAGRRHPTSARAILKMLFLAERHVAADFRAMGRVMDEFNAARIPGSPGPTKLNAVRTLRFIRARTCDGLPSDLTQGGVRW